MDDEIMDGLSMDINHVEIEKLRSLFPQCFVDGQLSVTKLMEACGEFETVDENDREKYEFRWKGKQEAQQLAGKRSTGTLRPCKEESVNWDDTQNLYIEGDNLEVLKLILRSYFRKVKMIYIDPPYNTGNDFVYSDDFKDPLARYREITKQTTKSNPEYMGRFHTNWLSMMYPRLTLARNLLRDDGVIFISIDDGEVHNLRKLCDEVLGEENFVGCYLKQSKVGGGSDSKHMVKEHEYCIVYAKSVTTLPEMFTLHNSEYLKRYKEEDEKGRYFWDTFARPGLKNPIFYDIVAPDGKVINNGWIRSKERFEEEYKQGEVRIYKKPNDEWSVQFKQRLNQSGKKPRSMTMNFGGTIEGKNEINDLFDNDKIFSYPKSTIFVREILKTCTKNNDIILDFFSGSATTAHAIMQLNAEDGGNRRFMMVQLPELTDPKSEAHKAGYKNICEIGKERIRRAGTKIQSVSVASTTNRLNPDEEETPLDIGFKVFKLDSSNLKQWDDSPITGEDAIQQLAARIDGMLDIIKPDRSELDIVYEVMLKLGQELTQPVLPLNINGKTVYGVGTGNDAEVKFIICFAPHITVEDAEAMSIYEPGRIIFANACFNNTEEKTNVKLTLKDKGIAMKAL